MRTTVLLAVAAFVVLMLVVQKGIAPVALKQDGKPSTADLVHPPTPYGAPAVVSSPSESRR